MGDMADAAREEEEMREHDQRTSWDGTTLGEGFLRHHQSFEIARETLRRGGANDNVVQMAETLLWLEQNVRNLASDIPRLIERKERETASRTAQAILDYLPEKGEEHPPRRVEGVKIEIKTTDATYVTAEGARVGFVSCLECGAALLIDPRDYTGIGFDPVVKHIQWHEKQAELLEKARSDLGLQQF